MDTPKIGSRSTGLRNATVAMAIAAYILLAPSTTAEVVADPHRFDDAIAAFEEADRKSMPEKGQVLFLGSSSIRRWDTAEAFPGIHSINRGFGGSQTSDCLFFFDRIVLPYKPSVIVFYEGDNDIGAGKSPKQVVKDFKTFAKMVRRQLPGTKIVHIPIKPSIKRWNLWPEMDFVNQKVRAMAKKRGDLFYADIATPMLATGSPPDESLFADDGLHLSEKGNALWASIVRPQIENALAQ